MSHPLEISIRKPTTILNISAAHTADGFITRHRVQDTCAVLALFPPSPLSLSSPQPTGFLNTPLTSPAKCQPAPALPASPDLQCISSPARPCPTKPLLAPSSPPLPDAAAARGKMRLGAGFAQQQQEHLGPPRHRPAATRGCSRLLVRVSNEG